MNRTVSLVILAVMLTSCGGDGVVPPCCQSLPSSGLYATFVTLGQEHFHASITNPEGMSEARALWAGTSNARIPNALLVCMPEPWNAPWSWYMDPEDLRFAEVTLDLCQAPPSYVEANCGSFGRYCPASANLVDLRDCDAGSACPRVPR